MEPTASRRSWSRSQYPARSPEPSPAGAHPSPTTVPPGRVVPPPVKSVEQRAPAQVLAHPDPAPKPQELQARAHKLEEKVQARRPEERALDRQGNHRPRHLRVSPAAAQVGRLRLLEARAQAPQPTVHRRLDLVAQHRLAEPPPEDRQLRVEAAALVQKPTEHQHPPTEHQRPPTEDQHPPPQKVPREETLKQKAPREEARREAVLREKAAKEETHKEVALREEALLEPPLKEEPVLDHQLDHHPPDHRLDHHRLNHHPQDHRLNHQLDRPLDQPLTEPLLEPLRDLPQEPREPNPEQREPQVLPRLDLPSLPSLPGRKDRLDLLLLDRLDRLDPLNRLGLLDRQELLSLLDPQSLLDLLDLPLEPRSPLGRLDHQTPMEELLKAQRMAELQLRSRPLAQD